MDIFNSHYTKNAQETMALGQELAAILINDASLPKLICLYGDLGSGKTTFTQGFAKGLGVKERVLSPTYTLMREHLLDNDRFLFHLDLYRNPSGFELSELLANKTNFVIIEWADKLNDLPKTRIDVHCFETNDETHNIFIKNLL